MGYQNLLHKCTKCQKRYKRNAFPQPTKSPNRIARLVCYRCRQYCIGCGIVKLEDKFTNQGEEGTLYCRPCLSKREAAKGNLYYRFPMLHFNACPFPADKLLQVLREEEALRVKGGGTKEVRLTNVDLSTDRLLDKKDK